MPKFTKEMLEELERQEIDRCAGEVDFYGALDKAFPDIRDELRRLWKIEMFHDVMASYLAWHGIKEISIGDGLVEEV